jgi:nuclear receptor subfamily 1 group D protein 3
VCVLNFILFYIFYIDLYNYDLLLFFPDRIGLSEGTRVESLQDRLIEALRLQVTRNHSTEENLFPSIILKLPELRTLGAQHHEILRWYRARWSVVALPPLFAEIYDIPKTAKDAAL